MILRLREQTHMPDEPLAEALGQTLSSSEGLPQYTVVAHWSGLDHFPLDGEQKTWTPLQWAEHLEDPYLQHPFAAGPDDDRMAILHLDVCLHPDDRELTGPEWAEVAHRLARAAGIEIPGEENGCRWIAVRAQPGRLDLIANLIRLDGAWQAPPADLLLRLADEARRIEWNLHLIPVRTELAMDPTPTAMATAQLASVLLPLADEKSGPLATLRSLIEHTAHLMIRQPGAVSADTAHSLEAIARHFHGLGQDLDSIAAHLLQPRGAGTPTAAQDTAHRSL